MTPRTITLLAAVLSPVVAFGGGWMETSGIWLGEELAWATPHHPAQLTEPQIEDRYDPPPRAGWCGPQGQQHQPDGVECDEYDDDLTAWLMDFTDTPSPDDVAHIPYPPTYCGGC